MRCAEETTHWLMMQKTRENRQLYQKQYPRYLRLTADKQSTVWQYLASGSYNLAYLSDDRQWVYKEAFDGTRKTDFPERLVRLWRTVNGDAYGIPYVVSTSNRVPCDCKGQLIQIPDDIAPAQRGWIAPYINGRWAIPKEICNALIDIYNRTGRIIFDAFVKSNFIVTKENKTVCVDFGLALQLEQREMESLEKSQTSLEEWSRRNLKRGKKNRNIKETPDMQQIVDMIEALLFLKIYRPDITNVSNLQNNSQLVSRLAQAYSDVIHKGLDLRVEQEIDEVFPFSRTALLENNALLREAVTRPPLNRLNDDALRELGKTPLLTPAHISLYQKLIQIQKNAPGMIQMFEVMAATLIRHLSFEQVNICGILTNEFTLTIEAWAILRWHPALLATGYLDLLRCLKKDGVPMKEALQCAQQFRTSQGAALYACFYQQRLSIQHIQNLDAAKCFEHSNEQITLHAIFSAFLKHGFPMNVIVNFCCARLSRFIASSSNISIADILHVLNNPDNSPETQRAIAVIVRLTRTDCVVNLSNLFAIFFAKESMTDALRCADAGILAEKIPQAVQLVKQGYSLDAIMRYQEDGIMSSDSEDDDHVDETNDLSILAQPLFGTGGPTLFVTPHTPPLQPNTNTEIRPPSVALS